MSLSSIFSSESLEVRTSDPLWRPALQVLCIAAVVLLAAEAGARLLLSDVDRQWEYWHPTAATKFEFLRASAAARRPLRTLIVGDSTGAADLDPAVFEATLGARAWNAAWSGNFPLAFEHTSLPLLKDPGLVVDVIVASFIPAGFTGGDEPTPSEAALLASTFVQKQTKSQTGDYFYLARLRSAWPFLLNQLSGRREPESVSRWGFAPQGGQATEAVWQREPAQPPVERLNQRRLEVLESLVQTTAVRRSRLLVVIPPSLTKSPARLTAARLLKQTIPDHPHVRGLDLLQPAFLQMSDFVDLNHLNRDGAAKYSQHVADFIAAWGDPGAAR